MMKLSNRQKHRIAIALIALPMLFCGCMVEVPSHIIQPEEMEDLLYDYHLMQAMAGDLNSSQNHKRKLYEQYVFDKHHVTEADFDTSLTWYMRHTGELEEIYKRLNKRFTAKKEELANYLPPAKRVQETSPAGDTVNVWPDFRMFRLATSAFSNKLLFQLKPDVNYFPRDSFEWVLNALYLGDTSATRAVMAMTFQYDKDTVGVSLDISHSGHHRLALACNPEYQLKEIVGHVYYFTLNTDSTYQKPFLSQEWEEDTDMMLPHDLLLSDIALTRYHRTDTIAKDTVGNNTIVKDTLAKDMTPEKSDTLR